jgi:hypothetical protein
MRHLAFAVLLLSLGVVDRAYPASITDSASLVTGVMLLNGPGSGVANAPTCPDGNSRLDGCGGGSPAGVTYATTAQNWRQTISSTLTGGTPAKVALTPCPTGVDTTSGSGYQVLISGGGNSEAVDVISGRCVWGASSGTILFTPHYSYPVGSTIGSASSGIQETVNVACGVNPQYNFNSQCNVIIPSNGPYLGSGSLWSINNYFVYGTIFLHSNQSILDGSGGQR